MDWPRRVLRRDNNEVLRRTLDFEVFGKSGRGRPNMACKRQMEEHIDQIALNKEDATDRTKRRNGVYKLSRNVK